MEYKFNKEVLLKVNFLFHDHKSKFSLKFKNLEKYLTLIKSMYESRYFMDPDKFSIF